MKKRFAPDTYWKISVAQLNTLEGCINGEVLSKAMATARSKERTFAVEVIKCELWYAFKKCLETE